MKVTDARHDDDDDASVPQCIDTSGMCSQFVDDIEIVNPALIPVESFDGPVPPRRPNAAL